MKNLILEEVLCYWIPIQTLYFRTTLPTRQDGVENRDKAYWPIADRRVPRNKATFIEIGAYRA